ncbi:MAG: hypothetical protein WCE38_17235, partial [Burkholderiales bacterium]
RHDQITLSIPLPPQRHVDQSFEPPSNRYGCRESEPADFVNGQLARLIHDGLSGGLADVA